MTVYILPHSHHDLGYTDIQAEIEEKQMQNISLGIDLARKTASYPGRTFRLESRSAVGQISSCGASQQEKEASSKPFGKAKS